MTYTDIEQKLRNALRNLIEVTQHLKPCPATLDAACEALSSWTPQPAQAMQAEVTDAAIDAATRHIYHNGRPTSKEYRVGIARAILALRPERVPMTEDQVWHNDALMSANGIAGFKMDALMRIVRAAEAHHGITRDKEQA